MDGLLGTNHFGDTRFKSLGSKLRRKPELGPRHLILVDFSSLCPMPRMSVLHPMAYTTDIDRIPPISVVYATGYNVDIRGIGKNTI